MSSYIIRLDDACEKRNIENWNRIESLLNCYNVKPLVGIIPHCEDPMMDNYNWDDEFWLRVTQWTNNGWTIAMHGYNHIYSTGCAGLNPVNKRSEFAGESLDVQKKKIFLGVSIMREHGIDPKVFFAPSHTFDGNTLIALEKESNIRIVSDTIARDSYKKGNFTFVPQQSGKVRKLPFKIVTFCYHPNTMNNRDFEELENFLKKYSKHFIRFKEETTEREFDFIDRVLEKIYFARR